MEKICIIKNLKKFKNYWYKCQTCKKDWQLIIGKKADLNVVLRSAQPQSGGVIKKGTVIIQKRDTQKTQNTWKWTFWMSGFWMIKSCDLANLSKSKTFLTNQWTFLSSFWMEYLKTRLFDNWTHLDHSKSDLSGFLIVTVYPCLFPQRRFEN